MLKISNRCMSVKRAQSKLAIIVFLVLVGACSRREEPTAPAVAAADRALPVAVDIPPEPPARLSSAPSAPPIVPAEDRLEPVSVDDANVPTESPKPGSKRQKKQ